MKTLEKEQLVYVDVPFLESRKMPDPLHPGTHTYHLYVDTRDLPRLPNEANARDSDTGINRAVYKQVANSVMDGKINPDEPVTAGYFGHKHLGINVVAEEVIELNKKICRVGFRTFNPDEPDKPGDGMMNGGHGAEVLLNVRKKYGPEMPPNFIKVFITVGLPREVIPEIAGGNNASVQVQANSLANLGGKFQPFKVALSSTRVADKIAWAEGDDGEITSIDLIAALTCFRPDAYPVDGPDAKMPVHAYEKKSLAIAEFRRDPDGYYALDAITPQILEFIDIIRVSGREYYNTETKGRYGALKVIDKAPEGKPFIMPYTGESTEQRLNMAAVYPILAAFRALVRKNSKGKFEWAGGFDVIKQIWYAKSAEIILATREALEDKGYVLNGMGKSRTYWANLQRIIAKAIDEREIAMLRKQIATSKRGSAA